MARLPRAISPTGIYHIMLRGNERRSVFLHPEEKAKFLDLLQAKRVDMAIKIYAYCIMDNHAHLIVKDFANTLSTYLKRVGISYSAYYNQRHQRVGHVFQDRFRSEPIADEAYLLGCIRYVHNNPVKAGYPEGLDYKWQSYSSYFKSNLDDEYIEILQLLSSHLDNARRQFAILHQQFDDKNYLEMDDRVQSTKLAQQLLIQLLNQQHHLSLNDLRSVQNREVAASILREVAKQSGVSGRKLAEITGLGRETVRSLLSKEPSP